MEASRFGFDASLPPACKFDPTDADIVAHYLLPRAGDRSTSGWVMHEYHIVRPRLLPGAVLSRIKMTDRAKNERKKKQQAAAAAAKKGAPGPAHQPGPSNYLVDDHAAGNAAGVASDAEGTSSGAQSGVIHQRNDGNGGGGVGETTGGYFTDFASVGEGDGYYAGDSNSYFNFHQDQTGPSSYLVHGHYAGNAVALHDGGAGTSGAQSDAVHQGGDVYGGGDKNFLNAGERHGGYYLDDGNNYFNTST